MNELSWSQKSTQNGFRKKYESLLKEIKIKDIQLKMSTNKTRSEECKYLIKTDKNKIRIKMKNCIRKKPKISHMHSKFQQTQWTKTFANIIIAFIIHSFAFKNGCREMI